MARSQEDRQSDVVPQGSVAEKRMPHRPEHHEQRSKLEFALVVLVLLILVATFGALIYASAESIATANRNLGSFITWLPL
jgi:hypothetical protein